MRSWLKEALARLAEWLRCRATRTVIHTATHDCGMREPRCAPVTPGSVKRAAVELRADELLAVSKKRDVEGKGGGVGGGVSWGGGGLEMSSRDWNLGGGSPSLKPAVRRSSQLEGASLLRNRLHPAILARSPGAFFTPRHVLSQKSLYRNLNALRSVNLDSRLAKAP